LSAFSRALAKIAYCNAVAVLGFGSFRPLWLVELILGRFPSAPYLVGGFGHDLQPPAAEIKSLHYLQMSEAVSGRLRLLTMMLRLFANSGSAERGMPIYKIVV